MFYFIVKEVDTGCGLEFYRVSPRTLFIPKGHARYVIVGTEHHDYVWTREDTNLKLVTYANGDSDTPPDCLSASTWQIMVVLRIAKGARSKRQYVVMAYIVQNGGIFTLATNDEFVYIDGEFASEREAKQQLGRIVHAGVRHYLSFKDRSLEDLLPNFRSEFAYLAKTSS